MTEVAFIKNHYIMSIEGSIFRVKSSNNSRTHRDASSADSSNTATPELISDDSVETETGSSHEVATEEMSYDSGNSRRHKFNEILAKSEINKVDKIRILFDLLHSGGMKNLDDIIQVDDEQNTDVIGTTGSPEDDPGLSNAERHPDTDVAEKSSVYHINTVKQGQISEVADPAETATAGKSSPETDSNLETSSNDIRLEITARIAELPPKSAEPTEATQDEQQEDQIAEETAKTSVSVKSRESSKDEKSESRVPKALSTVYGEEPEDSKMTDETPVENLEGTTSEDSAPTAETGTLSDEYDHFNSTALPVTGADDKEYIEDSPDGPVQSADIFASDSIDKFRAFFSDETELVKINLGLIRIARTIVKMIEQFKVDFNIKCFYETHNSSCAGSTKPDRTWVTSADNLEDEIVNVANLLKLDKNVLINGLNIENVYGEILYEYNFDTQNKDWYMSKNNKEVTPNGTTHNICLLINCSECVNFYKTEAFASSRQFLEFMKRLSVKTDVYIIVLLTISVIGIILSLCIGGFIIVRILKRDILEGNPLLTIFLLLAVIFTYCSILPFVIKVTDESELAYNTVPHAEEVFIYHKSSESTVYVENILCLTKIIMMSTSFNLLFGIILARSLMLSNCDRDGSFLSHIDGYVQVTLLFFILLVQICVNIELYIFNARYDLKICIDSTNLSLYFQIYNTFLLILCLITAPFIYKSKRNYNEGLYLTIVVIFLSIVWFVWISIYRFYNFDNTGIKNVKEMTALSGLVASATGVLILIFIPRTYLMLTGIVRDNITASLPTLGYTNSSSVLDVTQYRSTQALYDTVGQVNTIKSGQMNPNYYMERPTTPSTSKLEPTTSRTPENTYERYGTPPSPLKVTRF